MPLHTALFIETNPSPAKYALSVLGKCAETVRLPMVPVPRRPRPPCATPWCTPA